MSMTQTITKSPRSRFMDQASPKMPDSARLVWLSNFEAEPFWTPEGMLQLPKLSQADDGAIVNRLEEMSLLLAEKPDYVILRQPSDEAFLSYLADLGFALPHILCVNAADKVTPISRAILNDVGFCDSLSALARMNGETFLLPYAKTPLEEKISQRTGLNTIGPPASVFARVNSKVYSRRISKELGLATIPGWECESIDELEAAFQEAAPILESGVRLVLKEAMGVSGKGMFMIDSPQKADSILARLRRKSQGMSHCAFVIEVWQEKSKDINYQLLISAQDVKLLSVKEIIAEGGMHMGHRFPPQITTLQLDAYKRAGESIGSRLRQDGVTGIVGVDSIISSSGEVFPLLEINARFNMSTFQMKIEGLLPEEANVVAKHYPMVLDRALEFERLASGLKDVLFHPARNIYGVLIQNFATVNANCSQNGRPAKGRLYVLLIGKSDEELQSLDRRVKDSLARFSCA